MLYIISVQKPFEEIMELSLFVGYSSSNRSKVTVAGAISKYIYVRVYMFNTRQIAQLQTGHPSQPMCPASRQRFTESREHKPKITTKTRLGFIEV